MNKTATGPSYADDWDAYWKGAEHAALQSGRGPQDKALNEFWTKLFREEFPRHSAPRLLDAACGNGAVTGFARLLAGSGVVISCMDYSKSAVQAMEEKYPGIRGVACDATETPFDDGEFDIVASQFGLEYAGYAAFDEAARLVDTHGVVAAIIHMKKGAIFDECFTNLSAMLAIRDSNLLSLARDAFSAGFKLAAGNAPQSVFRETDRKFAPAVETLKETLSEHGPYVAGGLIQRVGHDLAYMYQRIEAYLPQEVLDWLARTETELLAYTGRMQSMVDAALDETGIRNLSARMSASGLTVDTYDMLRMGEKKEPAAWIFVGRRLG